MSSHDSETEQPQSPLEALAQLQALDVRLAQIDHRVANLPQRESRAAVDAELAAIGSDTRVLEGRIGGLERQQRRHEDEVAQIESKRAQNAERLYDSQLTSPKEAEALTAEADSLGRRQAEIEDQILELMEQLEPLFGGRDVLSTRRAEAESRRQALDAEIAAAEREAGTEREGVLRDRAEVAGTADPDLVNMYEQRREAARGEPVVGRLIGLTCSACHLDIPAVDHERIVRLEPDEMAECPQCGALLVR